MTAAEVIRILGLQPLEPEGGYFHRTYISHLGISTDSGTRRLLSAIYYLITPDEFSRFHRLKSAEVYHHYAGAPADLVWIDFDGQLVCKTLGDDLVGGQVPQVVLPAGVWQSVKLRSPDAGWSLLGTTVSPGFEFEDFEMGKRSELLKKFPQHSGVICERTSQIEV